MPEGQVRCPVCGRVAGPEIQACQRCGWTLSGPLRIGPVTEQMREDFEADLSRHRRAVDARVAARITADPAAYQACIRGGPPDAAEWKAARRAAAQAAADAVDEKILVAKLRGLLGELQRPEDAITVVEVAGDGITITRTDLDQFGSPRVSAIGETATWTSLLPMLSGTEEERRFQLAGGMSQPDRERAWSSLDRRMPEIPGGPLGVVCRLAGWEIPDRAAAMVKAAGGRGAKLLPVAGTADATPVRTLLADLAAHAPLRRAYRLMVAVVDPGSGAVRIETRRLFATGKQPGTEARLALRRMPGDRSELIFAIFAEGSRPAGPLTLGRLPSSGEAFSLRVVLDGPGRVRFLRPEGVIGYPGTWDEVRGQVPVRVETAPGPVDLICAIDLSGAVKAVRDRKDLVCDLLKLLDEQYGDSPWLRVGVVTCTEHAFRRGVRKDPVTEQAELGPPGAAMRWLKTVPKQGSANHPALAPVEDLLHEAFGLLDGSRASGRAAMLVTVAGRPPHPWPQPPDARLPCPNEYEWKTKIGKLTGQAGARCLVVADDPESGVEGKAGWRKLGPDGLRQLAEASGRQLAEDLGLSPDRAQRIPLPLPDDFAGGIT